MSERKPRPTTQDIALRTGMSRATVSYVLNGRALGRIPAATRDRVLQAAEEIGWRRNFVATALTTGRIHAIGLVVHSQEVEISAASNSLYPKNLYMSITVAAAKAGLHATMLVDRPGTVRKTEDVIDGRLDGVICVGERKSGDWIGELAAARFPCVEIGTAWGQYHIVADYAGGARLAVEHLVGLGHRRIVHAMGRPDRSAATDRVRGFRAAIADAGLSEDACTVIATDGIEQTGKPDALMELLQRPENTRPTAIVAYSDWHAVYILEAVRACGLRVPDDVSVVGFDNDVRAVTTYPRLTTIHNPLEAIAEAAVALLEAQVEENAEAVKSVPSVIPTSLVIRQSTAPPPHVRQ